MMSRLLRAGSIILAVALVFGFYTAPVILAQQNTDGVVSSPAMATAAAVLAYWTPERMASARPLMLERVGTPTAATAPAAGPTGPAMLVAGGGPGQGTRAAAVLAARADLIDPLSDYYTYPYPFTRTGVVATVNNHYPFSTNARMFFTIPGVGNFRCSATVVTSGDAPRRALVLTAGHCINSGGSGGTVPGVWATNVLVCPSRRDGTNPFGCWGADRLWTFGTWHWWSNFKRDVGFIVTAKNAALQSIGAVVGDQGIGWDWPDKQEHWAFGYPAEAPFTGERMILCTAGVAHRDTFGGSGPDPMGMGCDMNRGASGGGWIRQARMHTWGFANSVNSYKYFGSQPLAMYGPYFDTSVGNLWTNAKNSILP